MAWPLPAPDSGCVAAIFLDTTPLIPAYASASGAMSANLNASDSPEEQLAWLDGALGAAGEGCAAVFAVGHHPGVSCGAEGDQPGVRDRVFPLLERHGVDAYLAGHDHLLALLRANDTVQARLGGRVGGWGGSCNPDTALLFLLAGHHGRWQ